MGFACSLVHLQAPVARAAEPAKLTVAAAPPPKELADPIRAVLQSSVIRLSEKDKPFFEFWFRKEIPLAEKPSADAPILGPVKEGTLLGAVRVLKERRDFKDEEIPPGVYVLRLGLQPEDGDHQGTAPTRSFVLLVAADKDRQLDSFPKHDALVKVSSTINAAKHPSNLNLQPVQAPGGEFPRLASHNDGKYKVLYLRLPAKIQGRSESVELNFVLVYEGKGQI